MKQKYIVIVLFILGLAVFSYPTVANYFSTSAHQEILSTYEDNINQLDEIKKKEIIETSKKYNEELQEKELEYTDAFDNSIDQVVNKSYYNALNVGEVMGRLKIDSIHVDLPIYHGTSEEVLSQGAGHLENSSLPLGNKGEYSVITAHRGLPSSKLFRNVDKLKIGEEFSVQVLDELMTYKVYEVDIVLPDETDWIIPEADKNLLTLLSCEPYMVNTHRILVKGELTSKEKIKASDELVENESNFSYIIYGFLLFLIVIVLFIIWYKKRRGNKK